MLSFLPDSRTHLDPDIFFLLFIPPLLYSDGRLIPKRDFLDVMRPVLLLAFAQLATVVAVGYAMHALIPAAARGGPRARRDRVTDRRRVTAAMTARLPLPPHHAHPERRA